MLKISEIYSAIQGETSFVGEPCTIIRLAGCNLECEYCDTPHKNEICHELPVKEIIRFCREKGQELVLITGGEPLLQNDVFELMDKLTREDFRVLLETNGSLPVDEIPDLVTVILDIKGPGSGMVQRMILENLEKLSPDDEVKFVISDRNDFDSALKIIKDYHLIEEVKVLFSPEFDKMKPDCLAAWIIETKLPIRLNLQIHKYIWHPEERGR
jgi:7-carboxy-7-deazaguanine synthase